MRAPGRVGFLSASNPRSPLSWDVWDRSTKPPVHGTKDGYEGRVPMRGELNEFRRRVAVRQAWIDDVAELRAKRQKGES